LTIFHKNGTYKKIINKDIRNFLIDSLRKNEIDEELFANINKEYPHLFFPTLDLKTTLQLHEKIKRLIEAAHNRAKLENKPLLIILSEIHGSKISYLLHAIVLFVLTRFDKFALLHETINLYHYQYGWDAPIEATNSLLDFAKLRLGLQILDLEEKLHGKGGYQPFIKELQSNDLLK